MKCNLNCPPHLSFFCCNRCESKDFVIKHRDHNDLHDKWSNEKGFLGPSGCVLDDRPRECQEYDCHDYRIFMSFDANGKWRVSSLILLPRSKMTLEFVKEYTALMEKYE